MNARTFIPAFLLLIAMTVAANGQSIKPQIEAIRSVGPKAKGHVAAIEAMKTLQSRDASVIPEILNGMDGANALSANWMRSAIESLAQKGDVPWQAIEAYLGDTKHSPLGRRLAYEMVVAKDPGKVAKLLPNMLDDTSLEIRRDAVDFLVKSIDKSEKDNAIASFQKALDKARDPDQIKSIVDSLDELGTKIDITEHMGYLTEWYMIGPFDNKEKGGFDVAYPPERKVDLEEKLKGVEGEVAWKKAKGDGEVGYFDLNKLLGKHKGAVAYTYTDFESDSDQVVSVRLTSKNGNKVWINGEMVFANHVYHSGGGIDQYTGKAKLKKGKNQILIKVCQNEQTQPWAQEWFVQFRITDLTGKAIKPVKSEKF